MASYATLSIDSLHLTSSPDGIDPGIMMLFRPSDRRIRLIDKRDRAALAEYVHHDDIDEFNECNPLACVEYRCSVRAARDRLDLRGFTREVAETVFKKEMPRDIKRTEERMVKNSAISKYYEEKLALMRSITLDDWYAAMQRIESEDLTHLRLDSPEANAIQHPALRYMLIHSLGMYGFPGYDARPLIRLVADMVPDDYELVYDLTDLIVGGWAADADDVIAEAEILMQNDFLLDQRVIVLTEGKSDIEFLQRSLKILYPHLSDYFHFFDFDGSGGGAGQLVNLVRAFAASDVRHRILAIFDNDTGAKEALSRFNPADLPKNIVVSRYPDLPLAQTYPTMGPSGEIEMDVNGLAGSLEIYLGKDVLESKEGYFIPVQWTAYSRRIKAYQGEVIDKQNIHERFRRKLQACESNPDLIDSYDWQGVRDILDTMRTAFHQIDEVAALCDQTNE